MATCTYIDVYTGTIWSRDQIVIERTSRLDFAKLVFTVFADRTMAYNLKHAIGLTAFSDGPTVISQVSEACEAIVHIMSHETSALITDGRTALWNAIVFAAN